MSLGDMLQSMKCLYHELNLLLILLLKSYYYSVAKLIIIIIAELILLLIILLTYGKIPITKINTINDNFIVIFSVLF